MRANSRIPQSAQDDVHAQLAALLDRHRAAPFRKPYADYNRAAFAAFAERKLRVAPDAPLILDSCCGVGGSTLALAAAFPGSYVVGVDQSAARLAAVREGRRGPLPDNVDFVRADLVDFWRLLHAAGLRPKRHYLLYPNPWPKIGHLSRRWHGHPVFPTMLELGGVLECRSNWHIYIDELAFALHRLAGVEVRVEDFLPSPGEVSTPFERKYAASGHPLYRLVANL